MGGRLSRWLVSYKHRVVVLAPEAVARTRDVLALTAAVDALAAEVEELRQAVAMGVYLNTPRVKFVSPWPGGKVPMGV